MMRFELGLDKSGPRSALGSVVTIALAYIVGGFIPLGPLVADAPVRVRMRRGLQTISQC